MYQPEFTVKGGLDALGGQQEVLFEETMDKDHPLIKFYSNHDDEDAPPSAEAFYYLDLQDELIAKLRRIVPDFRVALSDKVDLLMQEVVENAIKYGSKMEAGETITLKIVASPQGVFILVGDQGKGIDMDEIHKQGEQARALPDSQVEGVSGKGGKILASDWVETGYARTPERFFVYTLLNPNNL